jgi:hypothetical protein
MQLAYWRKIGAFLGFDKREQEISCQRFWQNSLFGGLTRFGNKHVRSGDIAQWKREFTTDLGYAFLQRFPYALRSLKYENSNSWVHELGQAESNANRPQFEMKRLAAVHLALVVGLARYL